MAIRYPVILILLLFCVGSVSALSCDFNLNPLILSTKNAQGLCITSNSNNSECYTYLSDPNNASDVWGAMPKGETVTGIGRVDTYRAVNYAVNVKMSRERLYADTPVTFHVQCGDEHYAANVTPVLGDVSRAPEGFFFVKQNATAIFLSIVIVLLLLAIVGMTKGAMK